VYRFNMATNRCRPDNSSVLTLKKVQPHGFSSFALRNGSFMLGTSVLPNQALKNSIALLPTGLSSPPFAAAESGRARRPDPPLMMLLRQLPLTTISAHRLTHLFLAASSGDRCRCLLCLFFLVWASACSSPPVSAPSPSYLLFRSV
jgi:hypothetical protein